MTRVLAHFWSWCGLFLEKCCKWKLLHFESSLFLYKFQLIWVIVAQVIACLVKSTCFWTDSNNVVISCGNWKKRKIWSKWKLSGTCRASYWYKVHEFWINSLWDMFTRSARIRFSVSGKVESMDCFVVL